jgi:hypothetical protein
VNTEMPSVIPMLSYENGIAALEWLARAFSSVSAHESSERMEDSPTGKWNRVVG